MHEHTHSHHLSRLSRSGALCVLPHKTLHVSLCVKHDKVLKSLLTDLLNFQERFSSNSFNARVLSVSRQSDDAGAALAAAMLGAGGAAGAKSEARGNGPMPGGGGLMEEMSALLARRYTHHPSDELQLLLYSVPNSHYVILS